MAADRIENKMTNVHDFLEKRATFASNDKRSCRFVNFATHKAAVFEEHHSVLHFYLSLPLPLCLSLYRVAAAGARVFPFYTITFFNNIIRKKNNTNDPIVPITSLCAKVLLLLLLLRDSRGKARGMDGGDARTGTTL